MTAPLSGCLRSRGKGGGGGGGGLLFEWNAPFQKKIVVPFIAGGASSIFSGPGEKKKGESDLGFPFWVGGGRGSPTPLVRWFARERKKGERMWNLVPQ